MIKNFIQKVEEICKENKIKFTSQRRIIAKVIEDSGDHPSAEALFERVSKIDKDINLATIYRNIALFEKFGLLKKHFFGDARARYESGMHHHNHLIDIDNGLVLEFSNNEISDLVNNTLKSMGYNLINYSLEVYGVKKQDQDNAE